METSNWINLCIFVATSLAAIFTAWTAYSTWQLVNDSRKNAEHQLRAYVAAQKLEVYVDAPNDQKERQYRLRVIWKNTGSTPARKLVIFSGMKTNERKASIPVIELSGLDNQTKIGFIAPGLESVAGNFILNDLEFRSIRLDQRALNVYWGATYEDIFGCAHTVRQTWRITTFDDPTRWKDNTSYAIDAAPADDMKLNCIDSECPQARSPRQGYAR